MNEIKSDLAQQIKTDFEDSFQGAGAKVGIESAFFTKENLCVWTYSPLDLAICP